MDPELELRLAYASGNLDAVRRISGRKPEVKVERRYIPRSEDGLGWDCIDDDDCEESRVQVFRNRKSGRKVRVTFNKKTRVKLSTWNVS
jgi:hypothetical protein